MSKHTPTPAAMRSGRALCGSHFEGGQDIELIANIIDAETGLAELVEATG